MAEKLSSIARYMKSTRTTNMRGLDMLILDIYACENKQDESVRVEKELDKMRKKFITGEITAYERKKYIAKIILLWTLGYTVDFGHSEVINLLLSKDRNEKVYGYVALGVLFHENDELLSFATKTIEDDLQGNEWSQSLALNALSTIGGPAIVDTLAPHVFKLFMSSKTSTLLKKKAAMCITRLYKKFPTNQVVLQHMQTIEWVDYLQTEMDDGDLGYLTALMSLILAVAKDNKLSYVSIIVKAVILLTKIMQPKDKKPVGYIFFKVPAPFLQVKLYQFINYFEPVQDSALRTQLCDCLSATLKQGLASLTARGGVDYLHIVVAIIKEAIKIIMKYSDDSLVDQAADYLVSSLSTPSANQRYISLELLSTYCIIKPVVLQKALTALEVLVKTTDTKDWSTRTAASSVLCAIWSENNIVKEAHEVLLNCVYIEEYTHRGVLGIKLASLARNSSRLVTEVNGVPCENFGDEIWATVTMLFRNAAHKYKPHITVPNIHGAVTRFLEDTSNDSAIIQCNHPEEIVYCVAAFTEHAKALKDKSKNILLSHKSCVYGIFGNPVALDTDKLGSAIQYNQTSDYDNNNNNNNSEFTIRASLEYMNVEKHCSITTRDYIVMRQWEANNSTPYKINIQDTTKEKIDGLSELLIDNIQTIFPLQIATGATQAAVQYFKSIGFRVIEVS